MNRTEQNKTKQNRTEQNKTEQNRTKQNKTEQNRTKQNRYLSTANTKSLKGIFAVFVLLHHIYLYSGFFYNTPVGGILQCFGYWAVGMFFFYSGYGLILSSRKEHYLSTFIRKRVITLYAFYAFLILIYSFYEWLFGISIDSRQLIQSFLFGYTIAPLAWYLQVTIVMYLLYWIVFKIVKKDAVRLSAMGVGLILYCFICHFCGLPSTWYESIFCLFLGMLWFWKKDSIDRALCKKYMLIFIASAVLFCVFTVLQLKLGVIPKMLSAISFAIMVTTFTYMLANTHIINNRFTQFLGKYSLEIYVCQGFFLLLRKPVGIISNPYIFTAVTIVGTIAAAMVMKPVYEAITKGVRKALKVA